MTLSGMISGPRGVSRQEAAEQVGKKSPRRNAWDTEYLKPSQGWHGGPHGYEPIVTWRSKSRMAGHAIDRMQEPVASLGTSRGLGDRLRLSEASLHRPIQAGPS